jgi:hypothetical protein
MIPPTVACGSATIVIGGGCRSRQQLTGLPPGVLENQAVEGQTLSPADFLQHRPQAELSRESDA